MTSRFVTDASAVLSWLFVQEAPAAKIFDSADELQLVAPWLWRLEVVNAVLVKERRRVITTAAGTRLLNGLADLDVEVVGEPANRGLDELAHFARPHQLTAYDAVYLELAMTLGLPLCTDDRNIRRAARRLGIPLVIDPGPETDGEAS